ncbi:glutamate synthetase [Cryptosporidium canis]|uniref:Lengsin n=1 Tax=Cryptosporidium canis TaxID=195482 RepID=A0A9D5DFR7_9CRYT|nr:glutamate synthetase [Cryptosporidium canis]
MSHLNSSSLVCKSFDELYSTIQRESIEYLNYSFCDTFGSLHHITVSASTFKSGTDLQKGIAFDSSSVRGMQYGEFSDMVIVPDFERVWVDPFFSRKTLHVACFVLFHTGEPSPGCVRSISKRAQEVLSGSGIADKCFIGPEIEFFVFESVSYNNSPNHSSFSLDGDEAYWNSGNSTVFHPHGRPNLASRRPLKQAYCAPYPVDRDLSLRGEILKELEGIGVPVEKHHHEVATCQHEIGVHCSTLVNSADVVESTRYLIKGIAHRNSKTATFMPKPLGNDNGSGMHINISLWKDEKNIFFDTESSYYNLSNQALYFIGGILSHTKAIMAFTNPTTNSYKRLVSGYETPTKLSYGAGDRNSAIRIPLSGFSCSKTQRIEFRIPDSSACPHLAFSAILCAGIDGILHKIHPATYLNTSKSQNNESFLPRSLSEALQFLEEDYDFLIKDGVFSHEFILNYIKLKRDEVSIVESFPTPKEFELYYE